MTYIISGFPGIGKSSFYEKYKDLYAILDSDSGNFKDNFPYNYVDEIETRIKQDVWDFILISSHKEVRDLLSLRNIEYTLIYPEHTLKYEYISRFLTRGSNFKFIDKISNNWNEYLDEIEKEHIQNKIILTDGEYLEDVIPYIWFNK